jgi:hypothetical protein
MKHLLDDETCGINDSFGITCCNINFHQLVKLDHWRLDVADQLGDDNPVLAMCWVNPFNKA